MLDVHNCIRPYGQTSLFINSITIAILLLVQPILAAVENRTFDSDELYSSEEYDSEDYEDKAKPDIRPLRDSRKLVTSPSTKSTIDLSLQTTPSTTTTLESSEHTTREELYTGTFKYVHNRDDYNYSMFTLPTIIGTLFTVDINEWRRSHHETTTSRTVKLLDPSMISLFSPRSNYTSVRDYQRFVHWANRQYKMNYAKGPTTPSWGRSTYTLYPQDFINQTAFQAYMSKNWNKSVVGEYQGGIKRGRSWIDRIASREFRARPWRNKSITGNREYGRDWRRNFRYWPTERNETAGRRFEQKPWKRRPYYSEVNETRDVLSRPWRRQPYYRGDDWNETVPQGFTPRPGRKRPHFLSAEGNETMSGEWRGRPYYPSPYRREFHPEGNKTMPVEFEDRTWREARPYPRREPPPWGFRDRIPPPWPDRPEPWEFGPPRRPEFEPREWMDRHDSRQFEPPPRYDFGEIEPPRRDSREFEPPRRGSREFEPPRRGSREFEPPRRGSREFEPPRRSSREFEPTRRSSREFEPTRRDFMEFQTPRRDSEEYKSREYDRRPPVSIHKAENRSTSREIDERPPPRGKEIEAERPRDRDSDDRRYSPSRARFDDRRSREKDFDDKRPLRDRKDFEDQKPVRDRERSDEMAPKDRDHGERRFSQNRGRFDDRPSRDRDFNERRFSQDRGRFDDKKPKDKYYDERRPSRDGERLDDRPSRDRERLDDRPSRGRERLDDRPSRGRERLDDRPSRDKERLDDRPSRDRDSDEQGQSKDKRKFDDKSQKDKDSGEQRQSHEEKESVAALSGESGAIDKPPSEEFNRRSGGRWTESPERYGASTRDYGSRYRTKEFLSIKRKDRDFWDKDKDTTDMRRSSVEPHQLQADLYRKRIEQRRDKELQLIEKKRRMFWKPTESNEATLESVVTTIATTTRRSYNKLSKLFAKQSEAPRFIDEVPDHPSQESTTPFEDEYMREWARIQEQPDKSTRLYDWITKDRDKHEGSTKFDPEEQKTATGVKKHSKAKAGGATKSMAKGKKKGATKEKEKKGKKKTKG